MEESCFEITPEEYKMTFDEKTNEMNLKFFFNIDEEEVEELNVSGKMFKSEDNKIGVEWNKESGNTFWLSSIIRNLNDQMKVLV